GRLSCLQLHYCRCGHHHHHHSTIHCLPVCKICYISFPPLSSYSHSPEEPFPCFPFLTTLIFISPKSSSSPSGFLSLSQSTRKCIPQSAATGSSSSEYLLQLPLFLSPSKTEPDYYCLSFIFIFLSIQSSNPTTEKDSAQITSTHKNSLPFFHFRVGIFVTSLPAYPTQRDICLFSLVQIKWLPKRSTPTSHVRRSWWPDRVGFCSGLITPASSGSSFATSPTKTTRGSRGSFDFQPLLSLWLSVYFLPSVSFLDCIITALVSKFESAFSSALKLKTMNGKTAVKLANDGSAADHSYVETDPTGRYGRFNEVLGKGAMKKVYKAIDEFLGLEVAWNQVKLNDVLRRPDDLQRLYSEVHLLSTLNHPSIIRFYTSWIDTRHRTFNFITEMFTSGTLREYRRKYRQVSMRAIKRWARQILQGLVYLHGHDPPVIHRDLKCDNIFVNGHLGQVKIGDLGLAAVLRDSQSAHSVIGTPEFMAPELYEEDYNELVDVYSFGMCVLEMMTAEYPYSECVNPAQIYKKVTSGKLPASYYRLDDFEAQRFIGKCLVAASNRVSAKDLLLDPFLAPEPVIKGIESPKPFLNTGEMDKLQLDDDDPPRTDMKITGKLNPEDDTIFLKVQIVNIDGSARNVFFPFDIQHDTPMDVATEMVKELDIVDWEPSEIAGMIDQEISAMVPDWELADYEGNHTLEHCDYDDHSHAYKSSSSFSSSQASSFMGITLDNLYYDDASSQSSSQSGSSHSILNYTCVDDDHTSTRRDKHHIMSRTHNSTRLFPTGNSKYRNCMALLNSQHQHQRGHSSGDRKTRLMRNQSLVDVHSQLLHQSLVEEVNKRRLFNTVGAVENIGFQAPPPDVSEKQSRRRN
ncbi:unnamed protein product, partial [Linum tenue]